MAMFARATFTYESGERGDLSFAEGDVIEVLNNRGDWWQGKGQNGKIGIFPFNYVQMLPSNNARGPAGVSSEKITKVSVELKVLRKTKRGQAVFQVRIDLGTGNSILKEKGMTDFRRLDNALKALDPEFSYIHVLPPSWADEIPLSSKQAKQRARSLAKYLAHNTNGREIFDMIILNWAKHEKTELKAMRGISSTRIGPRDTQNQVLEKIMGALAYSYQQRSTDPMSFFTGESKLVQVRFDWDGRDDTEISLAQWEYVLVLREKTQYDGWWYGQRTKGEKGLFPSTHVKKVENAELRKLFPKRKGSPGSPSSPGYLRPSASPIPISPGPSMMPTPTLLSAGGPGGGRPRKMENDFCVKSVDAYDELTRNGLTMESSGRPLDLRRKPPSAAKRGDFVKANFNAYVWDPQTQTLREFASSDKLQAPPKGVQIGEAGASGNKMEFVVGKNEVIDGLEEAIAMCEPGKSYRAIISPAKGYGDVGSPPEIPGNCFLVYDLTVERASKQAPIDRRKIFSVGISKPRVQNRPQTKANEFQGMNTYAAKQTRRR